MEVYNLWHVHFPACIFPSVRCGVSSKSFQPVAQGQPLQIGLLCSHSQVLLFFLNRKLTAVCFRLNTNLFKYLQCETKCYSITKRIPKIGVMGHQQAIHWRRNLIMRQKKVKTSFYFITEWKKWKLKYYTGYFGGFVAVVVCLGTKSGSVGKGWVKENTIWSAE